MLCNDTDASMKAIHFEHIDIQSAKRLNRLIGILKSGFRGNGQLTLVLSGGHVDDIQFLTSDKEEKKKAS